MQRHWKYYQFRQDASKNPGLIFQALLIILLFASCSANITDSASTPEKSDPAGGKSSTEEDFQTSQDPVPITGVNLAEAYIESYRDAPDPNVTDPNRPVPIYVLLRDKATKKIIPQDVKLGQATVKFDSGDPITGDRVTDARVPYQVVFNVPRSKLITESLGKDRLLGEIVVSDASEKIKLSTSIVIWLSVVALQGEKTDFGTLVIPPKEKSFSPIKLDLVVSANEQAAENVVLRGLGDDLLVTGGTCPPLTEKQSARLTTGCTIELAPNGIRNFSRVITVSYFNGIRQAHTTWPIRGRSAVVLGQEDATISLASSNYQFDSTPSSISSPGDIFWDGVHFFVVDGNRVLIWNGVPSRSNAPADVIIGQGDFEGGYYQPAWGYITQSVTSRTNGGMPVIYSDGTKFYLADTQNHRILIWNKIPQENGAPADIVLGQPSMNTSDSEELKFPDAVGVFDGKLFVGAGKGDDIDENGSARRRLFVFDPIPTANSTPPSKILNLDFDKTDFTIQGGLWLSKMYAPTISSKPPLSADWIPDLVMHSSLTIGPYVPPAAWLKTASDGKRFAAADTSFNRILYWDSIPSDPKKPADHVIGQPNFYSSGVNALGHAAESINNLEGITFAKNTLAFSDSQNSRVVILPVPSNQSQQEAQLQAEQFESGQSAASFLTVDGGSWYDFGRLNPGREGVYTFGIVYHGNTPLTLQGLSEPGEGFSFLGGIYPGSGGTCGLVINGNCTLVVKFAPQATKNYLSSFHLSYHNGVESRQLTVGLTGDAMWLADKVMGQANFFTTTRNYLIDDEGNASEELLGATYNPSALSSNGKNIVLHDQYGHRSLIWKNLDDFNNNHLPDLIMSKYDVRWDLDAHRFEPAFHDTSITPAFAGENLVFGDCFGNRVLIFDKIPDSAQQVPKVILGQTSLGSIEASNSREGFDCKGSRLTPVFSWSNFSQSYYAHEIRPYWDGENLYIIDNGASRIKIYHGIPTVNNAPPNVVITRKNKIRDIVRAGDKLVVLEETFTDWSNMNNSLVVWNQVPTQDDATEDYIFNPYVDWEIHEKDLHSQFNYSYFSSLAWDGQRLIVGDGRKHRILLYNGVPKNYYMNATGTHFSEPVVVLGQRNQYEGYANGLGMGAWSFGDPSALVMIGRYLYVADVANNRVVRFPTPP